LETPNRHNRRLPRIAARHAVLVRKAGKDAIEEFGRTRSIGLGGCGFESEVALGVGSIVEVMISVSGRVIQTTARVLYETPKDSSRFDVGVEFLRVDVDDRQFLRTLLEGLEVG